MLAIEATREGAVLHVKVRPQAGRAGVDGEHGDGSLKVAVRAAPEKGKANEEVVEVIAGALGVKRAEVEVVSGQTSRKKRVLVRGWSADDVRERLGTR